MVCSSRMAWRAGILLLTVLFSSQVLEGHDPGRRRPPNQLPSVGITAPAAGASVTEQATVTIEATAADSDGTIKQVRFYANGDLIGQAKAPPYVIDWDHAEPGTYRLTAVATDDAGGRTTSSAGPFTLKRNQPPAVGRAAP